jgi:fructose-1-phosphate kinase PfkB-like protein
MIRLAAVVAQQSRRATVESELRAAVAPAAATASERTINIFRAP